MRKHKFVNKALLVLVITLLFFVAFGLSNLVSFVEAQDIVNPTGCEGKIWLYPGYYCHIEAIPNAEIGSYRILGMSEGWFRIEILPCKDVEFCTLYQARINQDGTLDIWRTNGLKAPLINGHGEVNVEKIRLAWNTETGRFESFGTIPLN